MAENILLFPTLTDDLLKRVRVQKQKFRFSYHDKYGELHELEDEPAELSSTVVLIRDPNGVWNQDSYDLCVSRRYSLRTFQALFGPGGIACRRARIGMALVWTSQDSKQRGVIPVGSFSATDTFFDGTAEKNFDCAQLRGEVNFSTVLYIAEAGIPESTEMHLANENGYILGELESYVIRLDGSSSTFPINEFDDPKQPLWYVTCDWIDPTADSFEETVSINLNKGHKNYCYLDRNEKCFDVQLLKEVMAAAVSVIIEKVRLSDVYWSQIMQDDVENGSVGQAIRYFMNVLDWDLSTPESTSLSARKYFDQRM